MALDDSRPLRRFGLAAAGGCLYALAFLAWAHLNGLQYAADDPVGVATGVAYGFLGPFLIAAVPLYLLCRFSLVAPVLVAGWSFANLLYLRWYAFHPHPVSSYLVVWPLFVGSIVAAAIVEFAVRFGAGRLIDRFGPRALL